MCWVILSRYKLMWALVFKVQNNKNKMNEEQN